MATTVVTNFADLRTAALDATIDYIYVNASFMIETGGILIPKNKPSLVIDCRYPDDDATGVIHTLTDINGNSHTNCIRVALTTGSFHLTLKNCKFVGRNFYGAISAVNGGAQSATTLTLENVDYSGPQSAYNRYGTVEYIGGNYMIGPYNGTTTNNEFVEANQLIISKKITIDHTSTAGSCFYVSEANPKFILKEDAELTLTVHNRELFYNDVVGMDFTIEDGSKFHATMEDAMFYTSAMRANFISIGNNAEFVLNQQSASGSIPTVQTIGDFTAGSGSKVMIIRRNFTSTTPLIQFTATATANFSDPLAVVLYNPTGRVINWSAGTGTLVIDAQILNYWTVATAFPTAGTFEDEPLYNWTKKDDSNTNTTATLSTSATTAVTTNLIIDEDADVIPTTSSFNVQNARVLAFGRLDLTLDQPKQKDTQVKGTSYDGATIRVLVNDAEKNRQVSSANYSLAVSPPLNKNDEVKVGANIDFKTRYVTLKALGIIELIVPERLPFVRVAVPTPQSLFERVDPNWSILVRDWRDDESDWALFVAAAIPLTKLGGVTLDDALVYKENATINVLVPAPALKIFEGTKNLDPSHTDTVISWQAIQGFLMQLIPNTLYESGHYEGRLDFHLEDI